jgi:hypothetical protein
MLKLFGNTSSVPSSLNNPFATDKVEDIWIHMRKSLFSEEFSFSGSVEFSNGRTKGEQKFEGTDIMDVVKQIYSFLEELK